MLDPTWGVALLDSAGETRRARFEAVRDLFDEVCELPPAEQERLLAERCAGDAELRAEVELLLDADRDSASGLEAPALDDFHLDRAVDSGRGSLESVGSVLGSYRLVEELGTGGFGTVFLAEQEGPLRRQVALKVVKPGMDTREVLARFDTERRALALMNHRNIARVYDAGATPSGRPYFVMELVRGERITHYADRTRLSVRQRLELFGQVCAAIQHAHQKGILHRDVKPSNVLVTEEEGAPVVKVIDFGIARAVETGVDDATLVTAVHGPIGTPEYMSPEQTGLEGLDVDTRSDVYSLCVLLYELLVGATPFERRRSGHSSYTALQRAIREEEAVRPSRRLLRDDDALADASRARRCSPRQLLRQLRGDLDWVVMRGLEKDRARRYETVAALADDLERYLDHEPVSATPPSGAYRLAKFARRNRVGIAVGAALVAGLAVAASGWKRALDERDQKSAALEAKAEALGEKVAALAEKDVALEEALAATDFLADAIAAANPEEQDKDMTVRALLDLTAPRIAEKFADSPRVAARLHEAVGMAYDSLGLFSEAVEHFSKGVELRTSSGEANGAPTLNMKLFLANAYRRSAKFEAAAEHYVDGLARAREHVGEGSMLVCTYLTEHGLLLKDLGEMDEALAHFEEAMAIWNGIEDAPVGQRINILTGLSIVYARRGEFVKAEPMFEEILANGLERTGPDSVVTLQARYNLATLYTMQGRYDEALEMDREVLATRRRTHGDDHPTTAVAMSAVASGLGRGEDPEEGMALYREALAVFEARFPEGHETTFDVLMNMGILEKNRGNHDASIAYCRESLERREAFSGPDHWSTIKALDDYGLALSSGGRLEEALVALDDARDRGLDHLEITDPVVLHTLLHRAETLRKLDRIDEAVVAFEELVAAAESAGIGDHYLLSGGRIGLALCLVEAQDEALRDPARALELARAAHDSPVERGPQAFAVLGTVEAANDNTDEAIAALERALELGLPERDAIEANLEVLRARRDGDSAGG